MTITDLRNMLLFAIRSIGINITSSVSVRYGTIICRQIKYIFRAGIETAARSADRHLLSHCVYRAFNLFYFIIYFMRFLRCAVSLTMFSFIIKVSDNQILIRT